MSRSKTYRDFPPEIKLTEEEYDRLRDIKRRVKYAKFIIRQNPELMAKFNLSPEESDSSQYSNEDEDLARIAKPDDPETVKFGLIEIGKLLIKYSKMATGPVSKKTTANEKKEEIPEKKIEKTPEKKVEIVVEKKVEKEVVKEPEKKMEEKPKAPKFVPKKIVEKAEEKKEVVPFDPNMTIRRWLKQLGMLRYVYRFETNGYKTVSSVKSFNERDLDRCEVYEIAHRRIIASAIEEMKLTKLGPKKDGSDEKVPKIESGSVFCADVECNAYKCEISDLVIFKDRLFLMKAVSHQCKHVPWERIEKMIGDQVHELIEFTHVKQTLKFRGLSNGSRVLMKIDITKPEEAGLLPVKGVFKTNREFKEYLSSRQEELRTKQEKIREQTDEIFRKQQQKLEEDEKRQEDYRKKKEEEERVKEEKKEALMKIGTEILPYDNPIDMASKSKFDVPFDTSKMTKKPHLLSYDELTKLKPNTLIWLHNSGHWAPYYFLSLFEIENVGRGFKAQHKYEGTMRVFPIEEEYYPCILKDTVTEDMMNEDDDIQNLKEYTKSKLSRLDEEREWLEAVQKYPLSKQREVLNKMACVNVRGLKTAEDVSKDLDLIKQKYLQGKGHEVRLEQEWVIVDKHRHIYESGRIVPRKFPDEVKEPVRSMSHPIWKMDLPIEDEDKDDEKERESGKEKEEKEEKEPKKEKEEKTEEQEAEKPKTEIESQSEEVVAQPEDASTGKKFNDYTKVYQSTKPTRLVGFKYVLPEDAVPPTEDAEKSAKVSLMMLQAKDAKQLEKELSEQAKPNPKEKKI